MVAYTTLFTVLTIASAQCALAAPTSTTSLQLKCVCGNDKLNTDITSQLCKEVTQDDPEIASLVNGHCVFTGPIVESASDRAIIVENFRSGCAQVNEKCKDAKSELLKPAPQAPVNPGREFKTLPVMGAQKFDM